MNPFLLFRFFLALLLALTASLAMACEPEYNMAMTQFAAEAKVIVVIDPRDVRPADLDEQEEYGISIWLNTPMEYLKGSEGDTAIINRQLQWLIREGKKQPGSKIFVMLIPMTRASRYLVSYTENRKQLVAPRYAEGYETRLRELLALTAQNDLAAQWRWVIRGVTAHEMASPTWQDAYLTVKYTAYQGEVDSREEPSGLALAAFPADLRPELGAYVVGQLAAHRGKPLANAFDFLLLAVRAGVQNLAPPCIRYVHAALECFENNRKQEKSASILEEEFANLENWSDYFSLDPDTKNVGMLVTRCAGATSTEIAEANRGLLYLTRMNIEYPGLFMLYPNYFLPSSEQEINHLCTSSSLDGSFSPESIFALFREREELSYDEDHAPLLAKTRAALRAFTIEVAPALDMCNDPYITALTGERNWWGCHQAEVKLETFVLAGAASASGDPALSIAAAPNPIAHGQCTLEWKTASEQPRVRLALVDANGREVWSQSHEQIRYAPVQQAVLTLPANLAAGTYLLKVQYPDQALEVKVLVE